MYKIELNKDDLRLIEQALILLEVSAVQRIKQIYPKLRPEASEQNE